MPPTRVVNISTGARYDVYIGREFHGLRRSPWANPFIAGRDGTRTEVIQHYREYIRNCIHHGVVSVADIASLHGKILGCWCFPKPCHGDVLAELAAEYAPLALPTETQQELPDA